VAAGEIIEATERTHVSGLDPLKKWRARRDSNPRPSA
jgi:hypothetical protein